MQEQYREIKENGTLYDEKELLYEEYLAYLSVEIYDYKDELYLALIDNHQQCVHLRKMDEIDIEE